MSIRKTSLRSTQGISKNVGYSSGQKSRGISGGKSGTGGTTVGNKLTADPNRSPAKGAASPFKPGSRA